MNILSRYLFKEFITYTAICELVFTGLYLIIHFFGRVDEFSEASLPTRVVISYFLYKVPIIFVHTLPVSTLIATIVVFSIMKKNNEITALKSGGIDILQLARPLLILGVFISTGLFLFSETIVPITSSKSYEIWRVKVRQKDPGRYFGRDQIWYKAQGAIYWIKRFDPKRGIMKRPCFYFFDDSFRLRQRIEAQQAVWKGNKWQAINGIIIKRTEEGYVSEIFQIMDLDIPERPEAFVQEELKPEELSYWQLKGFIQRIRAEGYDPTKYLVDLHIKIAFPFIVVIMILIGLPLTLKIQKGGAAVSVSAGIALAFLYLLVLGTCRALGFAGIFPPLLAAWLANGLFFFMGIYFLLRVPR